MYYTKLELKVETLDACCKHTPIIYIVFHKSILLNAFLCLYVQTKLCDLTIKECWKAKLERIFRDAFALYLPQGSPQEEMLCLKAETCRHVPPAVNLAIPDVPI